MNATSRELPLELKPPADTEAETPSGTFTETKRVTGLLRMVQAGVIVIDYSTVAVEMLKDNANPKAGPLYGALDMPFAGLVGQLAGAFAKR